MSGPTVAESPPTLGSASTSCITGSGGVQVGGWLQVGGLRDGACVSWWCCLNLWGTIWGSLWCRAAGGAVLSLGPGEWQCPGGWLQTGGHINKFMGYRKGKVVVQSSWWCCSSWLGPGEWQCPGWWLQTGGHIKSIQGIGEGCQPGAKGMAGGGAVLRLMLCQLLQL